MTNVLGLYPIGLDKRVAGWTFVSYCYTGRVAPYWLEERLTSLSFSLHSVQILV